MGSLRTRVALGCALAAALVTAVAAIVAARLAADAERDTIERRVERAAQSVDARLVASLVTRLGGPGARPLRGVLSSDVFLVVEVDGQEQVALGDPPSGLDLPDAPGVDDLTADDGTHVLVHTEVTPLPRAAEPALTHVGGDLGAADAAAREAFRRVAVVGALATVAAAALGWAVARSATRPLAALQQVADDVASGRDEQARAPVTGPREVATVATALNTMLDRLDEAKAATEESLDASRSFASAVGHELRTPLSSIRTDLDVLHRNPDLPAGDRTAVVDAARRQLARTVTTIDALEDLVRGDLGQAGSVEEVDVADLVTSEVAALARTHPTATVDLDLAPGPQVVTGLTEGLRLLVRNVLVNAAVHGRRGDAAAQVTVAVRETGEHVILAVDDAGPGLTDDEQVQATSRFWRAGPAAGSGLGLAIVQQQAALHGGAVELAESPSGGLRVSVRLPRRRTAAPPP